MSKIMLSKDAAMKAISYSNDAKEDLLANINIMDGNVNSQFNGLQDPTIKKYLDLSEQMQNTIKQIGAKMEAISEYCQSVIRWIDAYSDI